MKLSRIYSDVLYENFKTQKKKFIQQGYAPEIVQDYLEKFKFLKDFRELKSNEISGNIPPPERRTDIDSYKTFNQLETVVDYVSGQRAVGSSMKSGGEIETSGDAIFKDEDFVVSYADNPRACIQYKGSIPYGWCISRSDSSNMFYTYRFKENEPAFYFVKDVKATEKEFARQVDGEAFKGFEDKYHFFVVQVPKNVIKDKDDYPQYIVSSANNDGDKKMSCNEILKINPNLEKIKNHLEPKPFTSDEKNKHRRFKNGVGDREFVKLPYEDKKTYLEIYPAPGKPISYEQLKSLPGDLLNLYVSYGIGLTPEQDDLVKANYKKIYKRYAFITSRKYEEYKNNATAYARSGYLLNYSEVTTLPNEDKTEYLKTLRSGELNRLVIDGGDEAYDMVTKHFPKKFTNEIKKLIDLIRSDGTNEESYAAILPEGYGAYNSGDKVHFTFPDSTTSRNGYYGGVSDMLERFSDLDEETIQLYDGYQVWEDEDIYDGWEEGLNDDIDEYVDKALAANDNHLLESVQSVGISATTENVIELLESQKKYDHVESALKEERNQTEYNAKVRATDEIETKMNAIIEVDASSDEVQINGRALSMFIASNELFNTDEKEYNYNFSSLLQEILSDNDLPSGYDDMRETVDNNAHQHYEFNEEGLISIFIDTITEALEEFYEENDESDIDDDVDDGVSKTRLEQLRYTVIVSLNNTLKGLGEDPNATTIENDMVKIDINRNNFKLSGMVYVIITNKNTGNEVEGYIEIEKIATYFTNYSLFEAFRRFKNLL